MGRWFPLNDLRDGKVEPMIGTWAEDNRKYFDHSGVATEALSLSNASNNTSACRFSGM